MVERYPGEEFEHQAARQASINRNKELAQAVDVFIKEISERYTYARLDIDLYLIREQCVAIGMTALKDVFEIFDEEPREGDMN